MAVLFSGIKSDEIDEDVALLGTPYRYDLSQIKTTDGDSYTEIKSGNSASTKTISTATNSPIFYIDQMDFSSLFHNFIKPPPAFQSHFAFGGSGVRRPQNSRPSNANKNKKRRKRPTTTTTTKLVIPTTAISTTTETPISTTTTAPTTAPTVLVTKPMSHFNWALPTSTIQMIPLPFVSNAKPIGYYKPPPNSKIIRLKTKFLANGKPSSVYMFNSPHRRYSLKDLLSGTASRRQSPADLKKKTPSHRNRYNSPNWSANGYRPPLNSDKRSPSSYSGNRNRWWLSQ
ncbi:hypothetical protein CHUAL_006596 [Chamberlinius hualienensis]